MFVKTSKNGIESAWMHLTAKLRDDIINDDPDWIFVRVEDIYPGSPDAGKVVKMEKSVFSVVSKEFINEHKRQERETERHVDYREFESIKGKEFHKVQITPESRLINQETQKRLDRAMAKLTQTQRRRIHLHIDEGLSLREIAALEGVHFTSVEESIGTALKKIKENL